MTRQLAYSLIVDGGTDRTLIPIIQWAIHQIDPEVDILEPDFRKRRGTVSDFLNSYETGSMIIFVHRDAENVSHQQRKVEFAAVERQHVVPVIPVRMSESWLLIDGPAIARAADRPDALVPLPPLASLESLPDPKKTLEDLLRTAAGDLTGRRLKRFRESLTSRRVNVASLIADFSPLTGLPAFQQFQADLAASYPYGPN